MFHIYSTDGQVFSGPLEKLRKYRKVEASEASSGIRRPKSGDDRGNREAPPAPYTASEKALTQYHEMLEDSGTPTVVYHAYQVMSQPVVSLPAHLSMRQVSQQFEQHPFSLFPVTDDRRQLVAIISRLRHYETLLGRDGRIDLDATTVAAWAKKSGRTVIAAEPVSDVRRIAEVLVAERLSAVPITEADGRLVGIVSRTDILRCLLSDPPLSIWC